MSATNGHTANGRDAILNGDGKPPRMAIVASNFPPELQSLERFVGWDWERKGNRWTKPPRNCRGGYVSCSDPSTWCDRSMALAAADAEEVDGVGIALGDLGDGRTLVGIDLDDCRNPTTGELSTEATAIVRKLPIYWEISPSGTGVKGLCVGQVPRGKCKSGKFEIFSRGRYFTITGAVLPGCSQHLVDATPQIEWFYKTFITPPKIAETLPAASGEVDTELIVEALNALNPARADDYEDWIFVGIALHSADPSLLDVWERWSQQSSKYTPEACAEKWATFNGSGTGIGSLFYWAKQDGWKPPRRQSGGDRCTDAANAVRFAAQHGDQLRFIHKWGKWFAWSGQFWAEDSSGEVMRRAKQTASSIYCEAAEAVDDGQRKALGAWAKTSHSRQRLEAMIALAQSEHPIPISHESLDADPWLLNCANGTVDLRSGQLRPHDPGDLITKSTGVEYPDEPGVDAILWGEFLDAIFDGDGELIRYLQRLLGAALVGEVIEHLLVIFHGGGANGKSVFTGIIQEAMGDYAMTGPPGLLMQKRNEQHPTELADLFGKRLVVISETNDGQRLDEGLVKMLTGGESIRARRMREDHWQFKPSHSPVLVTNHRPRVIGTDYAIWRRLRLVPFGVTIPEARQDKKLAEKLRTELPAILHWLVQGCVTWQRKGLVTPAKVMAATAGYKAESDTFAQWFAELCVSDPSGEWKAGLAYGSYRNWCEQANERPLHSNKFGDRVLAEGFTRTPRRRDGYYYQGFKHLASSGEPCEPCEP